MHLLVQTRAVPAWNLQSTNLVTIISSYAIQPEDSPSTVTDRPSSLVNRARRRPVGPPPTMTTSTSSSRGGVSAASPIFKISLCLSRSKSEKSFESCHAKDRKRSHKKSFVDQSETTIVPGSSNKSSNIVIRGPRCQAALSPCNSIACYAVVETWRAGVDMYATPVSSSTTQDSIPSMVLSWGTPCRAMCCRDARGAVGCTQPRRSHPSVAWRQYYLRSLFLSRIGSKLNSSVVRSLWFLILPRSRRTGTVLLHIR